jgi:general stress protein YciG
MQPRIYTYKITFEEVPYYYYGVHKEKVFGEEYWGSPKTHKWCWELYTPKKEILELFEYSDDGWLNANLVEDRLIKPFYQNDKWCLNESCGGRISLQICKQNGINSGLKTKNNKTGIFAQTKEQMSENGRKGSKKSKELGIGIFSLTPEQKTNRSKKVSLKNKENKVGLFSLTTEEKIEYGKIGGLKSKELGLGAHSRTKEERIETGKKVASQKWKCTETGFISNAGNVTKYQRKRGIDTSKRIKIS